MNIDLSFQAKYNCDNCPTRCDGKSKTAYIFEDDVKLSETAEDWIQQQLSIGLKTQVTKAPAEAHGLPDLVISLNNKVVARVEVKAQGRAFMSVARLLPNANLYPYETVALNLSDLERYYKIFDGEQLPLYIVWRVKRPCIGESYWGQTIQKLREIHTQYGIKRRFQRQSTSSDYVNGEHKGVTVNYHFSLRELIPLDQLQPQIYDAVHKNTE